MRKGVHIGHSYKRFNKEIIISLPFATQRCNSLPALKQYPISGYVWFRGTIRGLGTFLTWLVNMNHEIDAEICMGLRVMDIW